MPKPTFFALPAAKRSRVLRAAVREFGTRDYAEASLDKVAARAGISKGSLYQYFDDKADLYGHLVLVHLPAEKRAAADGAMVKHPDADLFAVLASSLRAGVALFRDQPPLAALAARAAQLSSSPEAAPVHLAVRAQSRAGLEALIRAAQASGDVDAAVAPDLAAELVAALLGEGLWATVARRLGRPDDAVLRDPKLLSSVSDDDLAAVAADALALVRRALAPLSPSPPPATPSP